MEEFDIEAHILHFTNPTGQRDRIRSRIVLDETNYLMASKVDGVKAQWRTLKEMGVLK